MVLDSVRFPGGDSRVFRGSQRTINKIIEQRITTTWTFPLLLLDQGIDGMGHLFTINGDGI